MLVLVLVLGPVPVLGPVYMTVERVVGALALALSKVLQPAHGVRSL